jgi:predicted acetyltransferase
VTTLDLRPFSVDELPTVERFVARAFGDATSTEWEGDRGLFEPQRSLAARLGDELIGATWIQSLRLAVPGHVRPVAGVTGVAVSPTHRRQGVLSALMTRQLTDIHERGDEALAALWASEPGIYGRFGYGLAAPVASFRAERAHLRFTGPEPRDIRLRLTDEPDVERLSAAQEAASRPGRIRRDKARWVARLTDSPERRRDAGELRTVVAEAAGETSGPCEGYALYRTEPRHGDAGADGIVHVRELVAATVRARRALWRYLASIDLMAWVDAEGLAVDDPLFHMVVDPRRLSFRIRDGLFIRIVDLPRALAERSYRGPAAATVELVDEVCRWNAGRWRIDVSPDGASCERTNAPADLTMSAAELGAAYLGGPSPRTLALAGRIDEHRPGVLGPLSDALVGEIAPHCYETF